MAKSVRTSVQRVLLAGLALKLISDAVEDKSAVGDPVGEPPRHRAERWRVSEVVVERVEAEHDPLQPVGGRHDEVAHHRAPSQNFRARPCLGRDRDLEHGRLINLAESICAHFVPHRCACHKGAPQSSSHDRRLRIRAIELGAHGGEDVAKHRIGQHARVGVVARAMVAVEEADPGCHRVARAMREGKLR